VNLLAPKVNAYLSTELETPLLDTLYDRLWLVARKSGRGIDALHVQRIKGRNIIAEDPRFYLIWQQDSIYVKPLPVFLLNYDFWTMYLRLSESKELHSTSSREVSPSAIADFDRSIAVEFLRSYAFLIQHRLDFVLAKESHLIPDDVDWVKWSKFIGNFRTLGDDQVAKRYHYGQLRLSRVNWVVRLFRPPPASTGWFYEITYWSITQYVAQATIALVFGFASASLALTSMHVALSVPADALWFQQTTQSGLRDMRRTFWVFSIIVLLVVGLIWALLLGIPLVILVWQL
jgi:hypothetical protein